MFYHRYKSPPMFSILRSDPADGVLVGREIEISIDFMAEACRASGYIVPREAVLSLDKALAALFDDKLLIDNQEPLADDLMKLKRIGAADPVLFDHGTSGPQLAFYVGRMVEELIEGARWNKGDELMKTKVALATVRIGRDEFFYDLT